MTINELLTEITKLNSCIENILNDSQYSMYGELCVGISNSNPEQILIRDELTGVFERLSYINNVINYLNKPIKGEYILHKAPNGRYCCEVFEFTCGCSIEALIYDSYSEQHKWVWTTVEAMDGEYYLVHYKDTPMENLRVRMR